MKIRMLMLGACLALASASINAEVYKWADESGKVHYGDRKPERGNAQQINVRSGKPSQPSLMAPERETADLADEAPETTESRSEDLEKQRAANCETARNNLKIIEENPRIRVQDGKEQRYLSPEEIAAKQQEMEEFARTSCNSQSEA